MNDTTITICKNEIYLKRYLNNKNFQSFNTFTLYEFIANELNNHFLKKQTTAKKIINIYEEYLLLDRICLDLLKKEDKDNYFLFDVDSIINHMQNAMLLTSEYLIDTNNPLFRSTPETLFFYKVYTEYQKILQKTNCVSFHKAIEYFIEKIEIKNFSYNLIGFHQDSPLNKKIREKLNYSQKKYTISKECKLKEYNSYEDELSSVSINVLSRLNENKKIAIISDDPENILVELDSQINTPAIRLVKSDLGFNKIDVNKPYPKTLKKSHIIQIIILYIDFINYQRISIYDLKELCSILFNQHVNDTFVNNFVESMRKKGIEKINYEFFKKYINKTILEKNIFNDFNKIEKKNRSISNWGSLLHEQIEGSIFHNCIEFNREEIKELKQFERILKLIQKMNHHDDLIHYQKFKNYLIKFISKTFTDEDFKSNALDLYNLHDEIVFKYDIIYLLGFSEDVKKKNFQNPFLPYQITKDINSSENYESFIKNQINQLKMNSNSLNVSYAKLKDNIEKKANRIITFSEITQDKYIKDYNFLPENKTELVVDNEIIFKPSNKIKNIRSLLEHLQKSPRWAFYENIIGCKANEIESPETLNPKIRGILIHEILNNFWRETKTHTKLVNTKQLLEPIKRITQECLNSNIQLKKLKKSVKENEIKQCSKIIHDLIAIETQRKPFKVIATEHKEEFNFNSFIFNLIFDRIDHEQNKLIIIDYKTGRMPTKPSWTKVPIKDFQIPLYLLFHNSNPQSIIIYVLNQTHNKINEFCFTESDKKSNTKNYTKTKIDHDLNDLKNIWRKEITSLLESYQSGYFPNTLKDEKDLEFCKCEILLRIPERNYLLEVGSND